MSQSGFADFYIALVLIKNGIKDGKIEYWLFEKSDLLQEALDFYFKMRKRQELMNNEIQLGDNKRKVL